MDKKIVISRCFDCKYKRYFENWGTFCRHPNFGAMDIKELFDLKTIPDWCPLEFNVVS